MPIVATLGLSENYDQATGRHDSIERGEISKEELIKLLENVSKLSAPPGGDKCPPTVLGKTDGDSEYIAIFVDDSGALCCMVPGLLSAEITPELAARILCREIDITEVKAAYEPPPVELDFADIKHIFYLTLVIVFVFFGAIAAAFVWPLSPFGKAGAELLDLILKFGN